jgi:hypothetical protein
VGKRECSAVCRHSHRRALPYKLIGRGWVRDSLKLARSAWPDKPRCTRLDLYHGWFGHTAESVAIASAPLHSCHPWYPLDEVRTSASDGWVVVARPS